VIGGEVVLELVAEVRSCVCELGLEGLQLPQPIYMPRHLGSRASVDALNSSLMVRAGGFSSWRESGGEIPRRARMSA
jgi:hypothetical protein